MSNSTTHIRVVRGVSEFLGITLLLLLTNTAASAQNPEGRVSNIVLVHGAWADASGWKGVYDILVKDGFNVSIVQEPETSFKEDVLASYSLRPIPGILKYLRPPPSLSKYKNLSATEFANTQQICEGFNSI